MDKERVRKLLLRGVKIYQDSKMPVYSGYATLFIVTAVFPCIILIISIVNLLPGYSAEDVTDIMFKILPDLGPIKDFVLSMMSDLKDQSGGLLASAAAVTTLWSASKGVMAIQNGLNQLDDKGPAGDAEKKDSGEIKAKLRTTVKIILKRLAFTLMLVILIPALLVFQMLGESIVKVIRSIAEKLDLDLMSSLLSNIDSFFFIGSIVVVLMAFVVIMLMYAFLPAKRGTLKSQIPGALFTCVCWFAFTWLFSFFIPRFYHASNVYGSLASLFLVLMWLRYMVVILFAGGVLNHTLTEEQSM